MVFSAESAPVSRAIKWTNMITTVPGGYNSFGGRAADVPGDGNELYAGQADVGLIVWVAGTTDYAAVFDLQIQVLRHRFPFKIFPGRCPVRLP